MLLAAKVVCLLLVLNLARATYHHVPPSCSSAGNCSAAISAAIQACAAATDACTVQLGAGSYDVHVGAGGSAFHLDSMKDITIAGESSTATTLVFDNIAFFFQAVNCRRLTFRAFSIDMTRVPFTEGLVVDVQRLPTARDYANVTVRVEDTVLYPVNAVTVSKYSFMTRVQAVIGYLPENERFTGPDLYMLADPASASYAGAEFVSITIPWSTAYRFVVGQSHAVLRHQVYSYNAFSISHSWDVAWQDVVLFATGGMGIYTFQVSGVTINDFKTQRKRIPGHAARAMSITADGIHICSCRGGDVRVQGCELEGQGDDGLNVNTPFARVANATNDDTTNGSTLTVTGYKSHDAASLFAVGDEVDTFYWQTLLPRDVYATTGQRPVVTRVNGVAGTVTVSPAIPSDQLAGVVDMIVSNHDTVADSVVIGSSVFKNNRARGALLKQPNAAIESSHFTGMTSPAILSQIDGCYWFEGRPVYNWTIRSCTFDTLDPWGPPSWILAQAVVAAPDANGRPSSRCVPATSPGVFRDIVIESNYFKLNASAAITPNVDVGTVNAAAVYGTEGVLFKSNNAVTVDGFNSTTMAMATVGCSNVTAQSNWCSGPDGAYQPCITPS